MRGEQEIHFCAKKCFIFFQFFKAASIDYDNTIVNYSYHLIRLHELSHLECFLISSSAFLKVNTVSGSSCLYVFEIISRAMLRKCWYTVNSHVTQL